MEDDAPRPFVPRDVFRLLVRLESQKTNDVDTAALERRFHVPGGYGKDESEEHRERRARQVTPGPGAYQLPVQWRHDTNDSTPSSPFASKVPRRGIFGSQPLGKASSRKKSSLEVGSAVKFLDTPPPLGSFSRADRGIMSSRGPRTDAGGVNQRQDTSEWLKTPSGGARFAQAPRETLVVSGCDLGPAQYEVKRLYDTSPRTGVAVNDSPTPAVFGVTTDSRNVVWSPARNLPSYAVPEAWNSSAHYAKHKRHVLRAIETKKKKEGSSKIKHSASTPTLSTAKTSKSSIESSEDDGLDPFEWLRRLPHGEHRANALAHKHGLTQLVRPVTSSVVDNHHHRHHADSTIHEEDVAESSVGPAHSHDDRDDHDHTHDDEIIHHAETIEFKTTANTRETSARMSVSCRLQGGFVISVHIDATKKLRHLKTAIVRLQSRFQHEDQFDLFLHNGKPLTHALPTDTLADLGLHDRCLVQVVAK